MSEILGIHYYDRDNDRDIVEKAGERLNLSIHNISRQEETARKTPFANMLSPIAFIMI
jgi:hypothetical protein